MKNSCAGCGSPYFDHSHHDKSTGNTVWIRDILIQWCTQALEEDKDDEQ